MNRDSKACPSMQGTDVGYTVEYHDPERKPAWRPLPIMRTPPGIGVPPPAFIGPIFQMLGLLGFAQANAIAWQAKCDGKFKHSRIRIVPHEVTFDLMALKKEKKSKEISFAAPAL